MKNSLVLSGELRAKLAGCAVGKPETLEVTITPTAVNEGEITATISGVEYGSKPKPQPKLKRAKALSKAIAGDDEDYDEYD